MPQFHVAADDQGRHDGVHEHGPGLSNKKDLLAVEPVCDHPAKQAEGQHGYAPGDVDSGDCCERAGQFPDEPTSCQHVGMHSGGGTQLAHPQIAEVLDCERREWGTQPTAVESAAWPWIRGWRSFCYDSLAMWL